MNCRPETQTGDAGYLACLRESNGSAPTFRQGRDLRVENAVAVDAAESSQTTHAEPALSRRYPAPYTEINFTPLLGLSPSFSRIWEMCVSSVRDSSA